MRSRAIAVVLALSCLCAFGCGQRDEPTTALSLTAGGLGPLVVTDQALLAEFDACWRAKQRESGAPTIGDAVTVVRESGSAKPQSIAWYQGWFIIGDHVYRADAAEPLWRALVQRLLTPEGISSLVVPNSSATLAATLYDSLPPLVLSPSELSGLSLLVGRVEVLGSADAFHPNGDHPGPSFPGYRIALRGSGGSLTIQLENRDSAVISYGTWSDYGYCVQTRVPGIADWAEAILPIPSLGADSLENLYWYSSCVIHEQRVEARHEAGVLARWIVKPLVDAAARALPGPGWPPTGVAPCTLEFAAEGDRPPVVITVWDDWFAFAGRKFYAPGIREQLWSVYEPCQP